MNLHCRQGPPGRKKRNARAAPPFYGRKPARPASPPRQEKGRTAERAAVFRGKVRQRKKSRRKGRRLPHGGEAERRTPLVRRAPAQTTSLPHSCRKSAGREAKNSGRACFRAFRGRKILHAARFPRFRQGAAAEKAPLPPRPELRKQKHPAISAKGKKRRQSPMFRKVCKALRRNPAKFPGTLRRRQEKTPRGAQKKPRKPGRFLLRPARGRRLRAYQTRMTLSARSRLVTISSMLVVSPTCFCSRR